MPDSCKMLQKPSEAFHTFLWHFFPSLKQNFIAYRSSKVSSRPDCIFEIHQLWQSGFSRVYSYSYCSCSFEAEIIKISQSSHKMYSNNIVNFQEFTTISNACTKKSGNLLKVPRNCENKWLLLKKKKKRIFILNNFQHFSTQKMLCHYRLFFQPLLKINIFWHNFTTIYSVFKSSISRYNLVVSVVGKSSEVFISINSVQVLLLSLKISTFSLNKHFLIQWPSFVNINQTISRLNTNTEFLPPIPLSQPRHIWIKPKF